MDARIIYRTFPTLKQAALIRTVTLLWNQDDIKTSLVNLDYPYVDYYWTEWKEIEDRVTGKAEELPLPKSLKESVLGLINPIGHRIYKWITNHNLTYLCRRNVPTEILFTAQGTIDEKKTAKLLLMEDTNLDILTLYKLACINCLEDDIAELRMKIPGIQKQNLCKQIEHPLEVKGYKFVVFWTSNVRGKVDQLDRIFELSMNERSIRPFAPALNGYQHALEYAARNGFRVATGHFLKKLTSVEREECLVKIAAEVAKSHFIHNIFRKNYADVLCFLLSQMSEEHQLEVFKACPDGVLYFLLDWPWQEFFMETANRMWNFLSVAGFNFLLYQLVNKAEFGSKSYNYQNIFGEFWQESPPAHKQYVIDHLDEEDDGGNLSLLSALLRAKDRQNIKLILKDASTVRKENLIFSDTGERMCKTSIDKGESDLLKFFLQQCMPSRDTLIKFKEKFGERIKDARVTRSMTIKSYDVKLVEVSVDLIREYDNERPAEKGNCNPSKTLCTR